jgi:hypothetical protein
MSLQKELFSTTSIWHAAALSYCFGPETLAKVFITDRYKAEWSYAIPKFDAEATIEEYEKGELTLASAKSFVHEYNLLAQQQRKLVARGEDQWTSAAWQRGEVG